MKTLLNFVYENQDLIKQYKFLPLYEKLINDYYIVSNREEFSPGKLTKFFLDLNINPLKYTNGVIPTGYYFEYDFDRRDFIIPSDISVISSNAFGYTSGIERIFAPEGLKEIGLFAFTECTDLKHIYLPKGLTTIPEGTFIEDGITGLTIHTPMNSIAWKYAEDHHITRDNLYRYPGGLNRK